MDGAQEQLLSFQLEVPKQSSFICILFKIIILPNQVKFKIQENEM